MRRLSPIFEEQGIPLWGGVTWQDARTLLPESVATELEKQHPTGILVACLPYFTERLPGNLSQYARGEDYHVVVTRHLQGVSRHMEARWPGHFVHIGVDNSPLPERQLAAAAGLGVLGDNGLLLTKPWGSYVFLGTLVTSAPLEFPGATTVQGCQHCGACAGACPGGALGEAGFHLERCLSHLTQHKGALTPQQETWLRNHPLAWGCDNCQLACPWNSGVPITPIAEFKEHLVCHLTAEELEGLTRRQFMEKYPHRAFTWRGPGVIHRNLMLQSGISDQ